MENILKKTINVNYTSCGLFVGFASLFLFNFSIHHDFLSE